MLLKSRINALRYKNNIKITLFLSDKQHIKYKTG